MLVSHKEYGSTDKERRTREGVGTLIPDAAKAGWGTGKREQEEGRRGDFSKSRLRSKSIQLRHGKAGARDDSMSTPKNAS